MNLVIEGRNGNSMRFNSQPRQLVVPSISNIQQNITNQPTRVIRNFPTNNRCSARVTMNVRNINRGIKMGCRACSGK